MKFLAILPAAAILATPAVAGPYVNIESETGFNGLNSEGTVIRNDVGYEGTLGENSTWLSKVVQHWSYLMEVL